MTLASLEYLPPDNSPGSAYIDEFERALDRGEFGAIVVNFPGLDYCKDRGLPADGAMHVFRGLTRAALETDRNIVVATDHSGEAAVPFFALLATLRAPILTE